MPRDLLVGEVTLTELLDRLAFPEEAQQTAALEQPKLYMGAVTYRVKAMKRRLDAEAKMEDVQVDTSAKVRRQLVAGNTSKKAITEKQIEEKVAQSPEFRAARDKAIEAKWKEEWMKGLLDAYEHRRSTIKTLAQYAFMQDVFNPAGDQLDRLKKKRDYLKAQYGKPQDEDI
jgi:hypothetical protein